MIKFKKKLAIVVNLLALSAGHFVVFASDDESSKDVVFLQQNEYFTSIQQMAEVRPGVVMQTVPEHTKKTFFPELPLDIKLLLARHLSERNNALILAQVNKGWHYFMLGTEFNLKEKSEWAPVPLSARSNMVQQSVLSWWASEDLRLYCNSTLCWTFRFNDQLGNLNFADLHNANGIFALPVEVGLPQALQWTIHITTNAQEFLKEPEQYKSLLLCISHRNAVKAANSLNGIEDNQSFIEFVKGWDVTEGGLAFLFRSSKESASASGFISAITNYKQLYCMKSIYNLLNIKGKTIVGYDCQTGPHDRLQYLRVANVTGIVPNSEINVVHDLTFEQVGTVSSGAFTQEADARANEIYSFNELYDNEQATATQENGEGELLHDIRCRASIIAEQDLAYEQSLHRDAIVKPYIENLRQEIELVESELTSLDASSEEILELIQDKQNQLDCLKTRVRKFGSNPNFEESIDKLEGDILALNVRLENLKSIENKRSKLLEEIAAIDRKTP